MPDATAKRSLWAGWTCAAATNPSGCTTVSITTASPSVSREVARKVMHSPVTGFWMCRLCGSSSASLVSLLTPERLGPRASQIVGRRQIFVRRRAISDGPPPLEDGLRGGSPGCDEAGLVGEDDRLHAVAQTELHQTCATWVFTVVSLTKSSVAISAFERPRAISFSTSSSRAVSSASFGRQRPH